MPPRFVLCRQSSYLRLAPKAPDTAGLPLVTLEPAGAPDHLQISFRRVIGASDLTGVVEVTSTVGAPLWDSGAAFTEVVSITDPGNGTELVIVRDRITLSTNPARYIRLRVSK